MSSSPSGFLDRYAAQSERLTLEQSGECTHSATSKNKVIPSVFVRITSFEFCAKLGLHKAIRIEYLRLVVDVWIMEYTPWTWVNDNIG